MFYQTFLSPQVKRSVIISIKHGIYELPHELPNDLKKLEKVRKAQSSPKNKNFADTSKKLGIYKLKISHISLFHIKTRVDLTYPVNDCSFGELNLRIRLSVATL